MCREDDHFPCQPVDPLHILFWRAAASSWYTGRLRLQASLAKWRLHPPRQSQAIPPNDCYTHTAKVPTRHPALQSLFMQPSCWGLRRCPMESQLQEVSWRESIFWRLQPHVQQVRGTQVHPEKQVPSWMMVILRKSCRRRMPDPPPALFICFWALPVSAFTSPISHLTVLSLTCHLMISLCSRLILTIRPMIPPGSYLLCRV